MPGKSHTLIDTERAVYVEHLELSGGNALSPGCSVAKRRLRGGKSDGVEQIEIDNGAFGCVLLPSRGMGLHRAWLRGGPTLGWKSPVRGPVHPALVPTWDPGGLGWLEGFDEWLCRCGLESNGAPEFDEQGRLQYPLHGRIANLPAHSVHLRHDEATGDVVVTGVVDEARFHFQKLRLTSTFRTKAAEPGARLHDEVANLAGTPGEAQLLYHINFGQPLLDPGSKVVAAVKELCPRNAEAAAHLDQWDSYGNERPGAPENVYLMRLHGDAQGATQVLLKNAHSLHGVSLHFSTRELPCFTLWKNLVAAADGFVTGLEPGTNFPNPRSFEKGQGRIVALQPGQSASYHLRIEVHRDTAAVRQAEAAIARLQAAPAQIHRQPQPGWTPAE